MTKQLAREYYLGHGGRRRHNCVQAVLAAFSRRLGCDDKVLSETLCKGGGQAPGGVCGAYCAARYLLEQHGPDKTKELEDFFRQAASSLDCKEIRKARKLSCLGCVEKAAGFVERNCT